MGSQAGWGWPRQTERVEKKEEAKTHISWEPQLSLHSEDNAWTLSTGDGQTKDTAAFAQGPRACLDQLC